MTLLRSTGKVPTAKPVPDLHIALRNLQLGFFQTHIPFDSRDK